MRERKKYYVGLKTTSVNDNKTIWNTMKPFLTNKGTSNGKTALIEGNKMVMLLQKR